jgi:hypothetical protein
MNDDTLEQQLNRPARAGDRIQTTAFRQLAMNGFCSAGNTRIAVCLLPGTEIVFDDPLTEGEGPSAFHAHAPHVERRMASFCTIENHLAHARCGALAFADGHVVPLTRVHPGQLATVVQLPWRGELKPTVRDMRDSDFSMVR